MFLISSYIILLHAIWLRTSVRLKWKDYRLSLEDVRPAINDYTYAEAVKYWIHALYQDLSTMLEDTSLTLISLHKIPPTRFTMSMVLIYK